MLDSPRSPMPQHPLTPLPRHARRSSCDRASWVAWYETGCSAARRVVLLPCVKTPQAAATFAPSSRNLAALLYPPPPDRVSAPVHACLIIQYATLQHAPFPCWGEQRSLGDAKFAAIVSIHLDVPPATRRVTMGVWPGGTVWSKETKSALPHNPPQDSQPCSLGWDAETDSI
jgi:hypothetical protein